MFCEQGSIQTKELCNTKRSNARVVQKVPYRFVTKQIYLHKLNKFSIKTFNTSPFNFLLRSHIAENLSTPVAKNSGGVPQTQ